MGTAGASRPLTCQAAVHHVVLPPKPENSLVWSFHRIHGLLSHFLKMFTTLFAPKECANVSPHGLQHSLGVTFKACRRKESQRHQPAGHQPWACQMAHTEKPQVASKSMQWPREKPRDGLPRCHSPTGVVKAAPSAWGQWQSHWGHVNNTTFLKVEG